MLDESKFIFFDFFIGLTIILGHIHNIPITKIMQYFLSNKGKYRACIFL